MEYGSNAHSAASVVLSLLIDQFLAAVPSATPLEKRMLRFVIAREEGKRHKVWRDPSAFITCNFSDKQIIADVRMHNIRILFVPHKHAFASCEAAEFIETFKWARLQYAKQRAIQMGQKRQGKNDVHFAAALWGITNAEGLHKVMLKQTASPPPAPNENQLVSLHNTLTKQETERKVQYESRVKEAAEAEVPVLRRSYAKKLRQVEEKETQLNQREEEQERREEKQQSQAKWIIENKDIGKLKQTIAMLNYKVEELEKKAAKAKTRKAGRKEEKRRNVMFNQPTITPTASKRTKKWSRKS
jgi:hypothetical protein